MHWADIIAALQRKGVTLTAIALSEDVEVSAVSNVIKGKIKSHRIAYAIAAATDIPTDKMWPGKYLTKSAYKEARKHHTSGRLPELKEAANG
ncbi:MAG: helix-turn-helix domain-containing protein [Neptuniibacter sp.]